MRYTVILNLSEVFYYSVTLTVSSVNFNFKFQSGLPAHFWPAPLPSSSELLDMLCHVIFRLHLLRNLLLTAVLCALQAVFCQTPMLIRIIIIICFLQLFVIHTVNLCLPSVMPPQCNVLVATPLCWCQGGHTSYLWSQCCVSDGVGKAIFLLSQPSICYLQRCRCTIMIWHYFGIYREFQMQKKCLILL